VLTPLYLSTTFVQESAQPLLEDGKGPANDLAAHVVELAKSVVCGYPGLACGMSKYVRVALTFSGCAVGGSTEGSAVAFCCAVFGVLIRHLPTRLYLYMDWSQTLDVAACIRYCRVFCSDSKLLG